MTRSSFTWLKRVISPTSSKKRVRTIASDARIIAATNRAIGSAVKAGNFREDLYYRINTLPLSIPPLRRRRADIPPLAHAFLQTHSDQTAAAAISSPAIEKLMGHDWPGNIRELKNVIERAVLFAGRGQIETRHILFE